MRLDRGRFGRTGWLVTVMIAVALLGMIDAVGPLPFAAIGFTVNLAVLGVLGGPALLGRVELSSVERATVALALPVGVLVLGTVAAGGLRLHLDRRLWAVIVAVAAEAAVTGALARRGESGEPRAPRRRRTLPPRDKFLWGGSLAAGVMLLAAAITLSLGTTVRQTYPAFSALSVVRTSGSQHPVRVELTSEETAATRFIVAISAGPGWSYTITLRLAPGGTWQETIPIPGSDAVTVTAYRGTKSRTPYREVYLAAGGGG
jgi:hypothetical protein